MGGAAFAQAAAPGEPTLHTPRMSSTEYAHLKSTYCSRLQQYFPGKTVSVLVEAPEKKDYGDLDFIVDSDEHVDWIDLARKVGAAGVICMSSGKHQRCSIGVPKDGSTNPRDTVVYKHVPSNNPKKAQPSTTMTTKDYAQIDIEIVPPEDFQWHTFYCSYGDLGGLLGNIVRNLGFTVSDRGLVLRLKELDDAKALKLGQVADRDGMLCLSNSPDRIMTFLGMSPEKYWRGFSDVESLYEWVAECRLISMKLIRNKRNTSRDRQRETKRSLYFNFFDEWLPKKYGMDGDEADGDDQAKDSKSQESSAEEVNALDREQLRDEAIKFFEKKAEFDTMHDVLRISVCNLSAERLLKPIIAKHSDTKDKKLAEIMRAFRRWVDFDEGRQPFVLTVPHTDVESQLYCFLQSYDNLAFHDLITVEKWVEEHWEELKGLERQRIKAAPEAGQLEAE